MAKPKRLDKDTAFAIAFANLKGSKHKDLIGTARALEFLRSLPEYSSNARVGTAVGVSGEIVREFLGLLKLPSQIQDRFDAGELKLEHGRRLRQLQTRHPNLINDAAAAMNGLTAMDARDLVEQILQHPDRSVTESKRSVLDSKTRYQDEYHVVAILDADAFHALEKRARSKRKTVNELVTSILERWLKSSP
jgi:hypothetical protein